MLRLLDRNQRVRIVVRWRGLAAKSQNSFWVKYRPISDEGMLMFHPPLAVRVFNDLQVKQAQQGQSLDGSIVFDSISRDMTRVSSEGNRPGTSLMNLQNDVLDFIERINLDFNGAQERSSQKNKQQGKKIVKPLNNMQWAHLCASLSLVVRELSSGNHWWRLLQEHITLSLYHHSHVQRRSIDKNEKSGTAPSNHTWAFLDSVLLRANIVSSAYMSHKMDRLLRVDHKTSNLSKDICQKLLDSKIDTREVVPLAVVRALRSALKEGQHLGDLLLEELANNNDMQDGQLQQTWMTRDTRSLIDSNERDDNHNYDTFMDNGEEVAYSSPYSAQNTTQNMRTLQRSMQSYLFDYVVSSGSDLWRKEHLFVERASMALNVLSWLQEHGCEVSEEKESILRALAAVNIPTDTVIPLYLLAPLWEAIARMPYKDQARVAGQVDPNSISGRVRLVNTEHADPAVAAALRRVFGLALTSLRGNPSQIAAETKNGFIADHLKKNSVLTHTGVHTLYHANLQSLVSCMMLTGVKDSALLHCAIEECCETNDYFRLSTGVALRIFDSLAQLSETRLAHLVLNYAKSGAGGTFTGTKNAGSFFSEASRELLLMIFKSKEAHKYDIADLKLALNLFGRPEMDGGKRQFRLHEENYGKILQSIEENVCANLDPDISVTSCTDLLTIYGRLGRKHPGLLNALNNRIHSVLSAETKEVGLLTTVTRHNTTMMRFLWANARLNNCPAYMRMYTDAMLEHYEPVHDWLLTVQRESAKVKYEGVRHIKFRDVLTMLWAMTVLEILTAEQYSRISVLLDAYNTHFYDKRNNSLGRNGSITSGFFRTSMDQISLDQQLMNNNSTQISRNLIDNSNYRDKDVKVKISHLQRAVGTTLQSMGIPHVSEHILNIGYSADLFISPTSDFAHYIYTADSGTGFDYRLHSESLGTVVEVDGPAHFETYMRQPLGPTAMKRRHIRQAGYNLCIIPYWKWDARMLNAEKKQVIIEALRESVADAE